MIDILERIKSGRDRRIGKYRNVNVPSIMFDVIEISDGYVTYVGRSGSDYTHKRPLDDEDVIYLFDPKNYTKIS